MIQRCLDLEGYLILLPLVQFSPSFLSLLLLLLLPLLLPLSILLYTISINIRPSSSSSSLYRFVDTTSTSIPTKIIPENNIEMSSNEQAEVWPERDLRKVEKGWSIAMLYSKERLKRVHDLQDDDLHNAIKEGHLVLETLCLFVHACVKRGQYK